ncbi:zinc finger protein 436 [Clinocottus analis]|uniref:zinc finger protein 436 n=1 Tax=Clinocottus analis TaxID=304258 RepID=UPI0035C1C6C5
MLDKTSAEEQPTRHCSDCGCSLPQPDTDSPPKQQQRGAKAASASKCPACQAGGRPPKRRRLSNGRSLRLDPHSCSLCSKTFISSTHLTLHLTSHNKERKFKCSTCGKYFHQASHLMAHKIIHSGDRPYKCECGKTFGRASHLKTHQRLHTGEKPFKCTYCDKSFTQKAGLLAHVRLHTGERPFKCDQCGEGFRSVSLLLAHKAEESSKPASASALNQPQKTQCNPEDLNCGVCCRTFVRSSYIRLHIRLNKGQRPYHCKVCNKTFVKLDTFVNHCDKHLRQKRNKSVVKEVKEEVVKPPLFVPLSRASPPEPLAAQPLSSEVNTRSRAKAKSKTEP